MKINLDILEQKLNIANELIDELDLDMPTELIEVVKYETVPVDNRFEVFTLESLKSDFVAIRQHIMKLILSGQRILETASLMDVSDLKAPQIMALSSLQKTLGDNSKLLIDIYRQIGEIEKLRSKERPPEPNGSIVNSGTVVNNQILFNGDTSQLLDFIKQNQT